MCPAITDAVTCFQPWLMVQVRASRVLVEAAVLSRRVTVAQSNRTVSGQVTLYQNDSVEAPAGASKVWRIDESPLVTPVEPTCAANVPECGPLVVTLVVPAEVQPARVPVSKPPLVIPTAADAGSAVPAMMAAAANVAAAATVAVRRRDM